MRATPRLLRAVLLLAVPRRHVRASATFPVTGTHVPATAPAHPGVRHPTVAGAWGFPVSRMPGITPALPEPGAADPEVTGRRCDAYHLVLRRRGRLVGHDLAADRSRCDDTGRECQCEKHAREGGQWGRDFHSAASFSWAQECASIVLTQTHDRLQC